MVVQRQPAEPSSVLVLALARGADADVLRRAATGVDPWVASRQLARVGLVDLLGSRMAQAFSDHPDHAALTEGLTRARRQTAIDAFKLQALTWRLCGLLAGRGVRCVPLKGPFLAERLHGDAAARRPGDIDLLVAPADLPEALDTLESAGYRRPRRGEGLPLLHHVLESDHGPPIDLHWRLSWHETRYGPGLLQRARDTGEVLQPSPEDDLISLLLIHARDGLVALRTPVDLLAWSQRHAESDAPARAAGVVRAMPALVRPVRAAALATDEVMGTHLLEIFGDPADVRLPIRLATALADPTGHGAEESREWTVKIVDGLLSSPDQLPGWWRRAALLSHSAQSLSRPQRLRHAAALTAHLLGTVVPLLLRTSTARARGSG